MAEQAGPRDPEQLEASGAPARAALAPTTTVGAVHLTVSDLGRALEYYGHDVGLKILARAESSASLGCGERELVCLVQEPGARPAEEAIGCITSRCCFGRARISRAGWRTPRETASRSWDSPITSSARPCT